MQPLVANQEHAMLISQESGIDDSGAYVIYSPIGLQTYTMVVSGQDTSQIYLQPCGIAISSVDESRFYNCSTSVSAQPQNLSLVTVAFQVLIYMLIFFKVENSKLAPKIGKKGTQTICIY